MSSGQFTLVNIVEALGECLTSDEDEMRTKGEFFCSLLMRCLGFMHLTGGGVGF